MFYMYMHISYIIYDSFVDLTLHDLKFPVLTLRWTSCGPSGVGDRGRQNTNGAREPSMDSVEACKLKDRASQEILQVIEIWEANW